MTVVHWFSLLIIAGVLMVGAEIFIPGGVLGFIGGVFLLGAVAMAFSHSAIYGAYALVGVLLLGGGMIVLWIRFFPRTWVGRRMTVNNSLSGATSTGKYADLIGKEGTAGTRLRPGGFAEIEGHRVDVVTDGEWIEAGTRIRVLDVKGNRVIVQSVDE